MDSALKLIIRHCRSLMALAVSFFILACSESEEFVPAEPQVLTEVVRTETVTMQDIVDYLYAEYSEDVGVSDELKAAYEQDLAPLRVLACDLTAHSVRYRTTAPDGSPIIASGVVYYPQRNSPKGVLEIMPINKSKHDCVSASLRTAEALVACLGYICIIPDLVGCGASANLPIAYMQHENAAVVAADLRRAADELIQNTYRHKLPSTSIIGGYSLGASIAWALARHYSLHPQLGVEVQEIWCGGGAYDPSVAVNAFIDKPYSQYAVLPNIICSMDYYDHLGLDFTRIFRGELLQHYREWCTGNLSIWKLTPLLGYDMSTYLQMEFFADDNPDFQKLMQVVKSKSIPNDWVPHTKVHLAHSREDSYVPRACSDELYAYLQSVGADVEYSLMEEDHVVAGFLWGQSFVKALGLRSLFQ